MRVLRAGVIGLGRMGVAHYTILNSHPNVSMVCACDKSKYLLHVFKELKKINIFTDYRQMLENERLDIIIISNPVYTHYDMIKEAINRKIHIFCEKPFTSTTEEGEELIKLLSLKKSANQRVVVNQIGYVNRYNSVFSCVKSLLNDDIIGEVKNFSFEIYGRVVLKELKSNWRTNPATGGGCLMELASHSLDLINWYFGLPQKVHGCIMQRIYSSEVEDLVHASFNFENGVEGRLTTNWSDETVRKVTEKFEINGTNGKIVAARQLLSIYLKKDNSVYKKGWNSLNITDLAQPVRFYLRGNEFTLQLDDFIESIMRDTGNNKNNFISANNTTKIIDMIKSDAGGIK